MTGWTAHVESVPPVLLTYAQNYPMNSDTIVPLVKVLVLNAAVLAVLGTGIYFLIPFLPQ